MKRTEVFVEGQTGARLWEKDWMNNTLVRERATQSFAILKNRVNFPGVPDNCRIVEMDISRTVPVKDIDMPAWAVVVTADPRFLGKTPRGQLSPGMVSLDYGKEGVIAAFFQRKQARDEEMIVSPLGLNFDYRGIDVSFWWVGGTRIIFRWTQEGIEYTLYTNLPENNAYTFIKTCIDERSSE